MRRKAGERPVVVAVKPRHIAFDADHDGIVELIEIAGVSTGSEAAGTGFCGT